MADDIREKNTGGLSKDPVVFCSPAGAVHLTERGRSLVCLVRHGQTDWNAEGRLQGREGVPLNEKGIAQSVECAAVFKEAHDAGFEPSACYTSPLERASGTAFYIANALGVGEPKVEELLIERDYGALSGLTAFERRRLHMRGGPDPGAEPVELTGERMKRALLSVTSGGNDPVVAVTHGGVINALFHVITGGRAGTGKNLSENCAVSLVAVGRDATIPVAFGLTGDVFLNYITEYAKRKN